MNNSMMETLQEAIDVPEVGVDKHTEPGIISPDVGMMLLTWITFFLLLAVLYKFAWKPILMMLDNREETIRQSLEDARKAREELGRIESNTKKLIAEADEHARHIVDRARKAAQEASSLIEHKAKEEAQILLNNATQEIEALKNKAVATLRQESAQLAVDLAGKIIEENLDKEKHQKLVDQFLKEFHFNG